MSDNIIEVNGVGKTIGDKKLVILDDISFTLERGSVTAIVGKSGSGKSTLLSIVSGIDEPTKGQVKLLGQSYYDMSKREQQRFRNKNIGILFQNYHLIPELTCEENIRVPSCFSDKSLSGSDMDKWLRVVGLDKKRKLYPRQMSGGEQQRAAILRAVVNQPALLFADEPTGALDSNTGKDIIKFLLSCAHEIDMTVLLVTHDMDIANNCDNIIKISDGRLCG